MEIKTGLEQNDKPRRYTEEDLFGLLVQKGGGLSVEAYLKLPVDTKKKVHRIFRAIRMLPDRFLSSEAQEMIVKDLGVGDFQRILMMLFQGGYLTREKDFGHRIVHTKTELAKTATDKQLAADIMSKNAVMVGFPVRTRPRKKAPNETPVGANPHLRIVDDNFKEPKEIGTESVADENAVALSPSDGHGAQGKGAKVFADHPDLYETLKQLDEPDMLMITDLAVSLKAAKEYFPKLSRRQFLEAFIEGGRYLDE